MKLLYKYLNGNVTVSLFDNGTKIQEWDDNEIPSPEYPNSMDIKITNKCDLGCPYCHEKSVPDGSQANLEILHNLLSDLPKGTELALGGGNPLSHSQLVPFLYDCKESGLIVNMTVNGKHVEKAIEPLNLFMKQKLIYGLGISIDETFDFDILNKFDDTSNIVFHVIAGVHDISILDKIKESKVKKVLILGYKEVGRGAEYFDEGVKQIKNQWYNNIGKYIRVIHLSFDNLAISQLEIKRFIPDDKWKRFYMGTDGQFTMYIDAVEFKYAVSSTSKEKFPIEGSIKDIFKQVRLTSGNMENSDISES